MQQVEGHSHSHDHATVTSRHVKAVVATTLILPHFFSFQTMTVSHIELLHSHCMILGIRDNILCENLFNNILEVFIVLIFKL